MDILDFYWERIIRKNAIKEMPEFERMMEAVSGGSFVGMPLSPNEQVLRAICYCDKATFAHHRLRRVDPLMPIRFATGTEVEATAAPTTTSIITECQ